MVAAIDSAVSAFGTSASARWTVAARPAARPENIIATDAPRQVRE
jgi:hypothetical protein